ncbi:MAG: tRNA dihydrouridine synthase DusB [Desulfuromonadaceae bacterium]
MCTDTYPYGLQIGHLKLKNNVLLAPMAGITNSSYRQMHKHAGASLVFSEMISANGVIRDGKRTLELVEHDEFERPFALQLFGDDPKVMAQAAKICSSMADMLDINMGCPVRKVIRSGAGSALMRDPRRAGETMAAVRKVSHLPLSVKIRSGWDHMQRNFMELGKIAEQEGVDAITLHPRTRTQGFGGNAQWDDIAALKQRLNIPVIGSGDIYTPEDAFNMLEQTGCDGVMIGRGGYGNPWLIQNILAVQRGEAPHIPTPAERGATALEHLELQRQQMDDSRAVLEMRKHLCWYARGLSGAAEFRRQVNSIHALETLRTLIKQFFELTHPVSVQPAEQAV